MADTQSPETYVGYHPGGEFRLAGRLRPRRARMSIRPATPRLNQWGLSGDWTVSGEQPRSTSRAAASSTASMRATCILCSARGGRQADTVPRHYRRRAAGRSHGADTDADGQGVGDGPAAVSACPAERRHRRPHVRNPLSRSRCAGLRLHVRLSPAAARKMLHGSARKPGAGRTPGQAGGFRASVKPGLRCTARGLELRHGRSQHPKR